MTDVRDRAIRAAEAVSRHEPIDAQRELASIVVHLADQRVRPDQHYECAACVAAVEYAGYLHNAMAGWVDSHPWNVEYRP